MGLGLDPSRPNFTPPSAVRGPCEVPVTTFGGEQWQLVSQPAAPLAPSPPLRVPFARDRALDFFPGLVAQVGDCPFSSQAYNATERIWTYRKSSQCNKGGLPPTFLLP